MKKLLIAFTVAFTLTGCGSLPTVDLTTSVTLNSVEGIVAAYGTAVAAETVLKNTPLCKTGTTFSVTNVCVKRSTLVNLQANDKIANVAVNNLVNFVKNNPSISPATYITSAQSALLSLQAVINTAKAGG